MDLTINSDKLLKSYDSDVLRALKHYKLTESTMKESVANIKEWYKKQHHLPQNALCDRWIIRHMITQGFSIERTKEKLDNYYTARTLAPEITTKRDPLSPKIIHALNTVDYITLPQRTDDNYRVTILRLATADATNFDLFEAFKVVFMIGDYRFMNDTVLGDIIVMDLVNAHLGHVKQVTPTLVTKVVFYLQSCVGCKIKGIHLIRFPSFGEVALNLFKMCLSKKISDRIHLHKSPEDLVQLLPTKILPEDFGGDEVHSDKITALWKETLQSPAWRKWFIEQDEVKADESRRLSKLGCGKTEELLGICGSFRTLEVD